MKAMILAAGEGTRMRPLTLETPKALLPINGVPLIVYTLTWLADHGISEVAINLHHLGEKIKKIVRDGSQFGMNVTYSKEKTLLGTAGGVKKMSHFFDGPFVVFYGDNLTDFDLSAMVEFHRRKKALATMAIFQPMDASQVGAVQMDAGEKILYLIEKPRIVNDSRKSKISSFPALVLANAAVYILDPKVLNYIVAGEKTDFAYNVFPKLIAQEAPVYGYRLEPGAYFIDIGTMKNYKQAIEDVARGKVKIAIEDGK